MSKKRMVDAAHWLRWFVLCIVLDIFKKFAWLAVIVTVILIIGTYINYGGKIL